jgi:hypothetical protein
MKTASEYRQYASANPKLFAWFFLLAKNQFLALGQECMDGARTATSDAARTKFLELTKLCLRAATRANLRTDGKTSWPTTKSPTQENSLE